MNEKGSSWRCGAAILIVWKRGSVALVLVLGVAFFLLAGRSPTSSSNELTADADPPSLRNLLSVNAFECGDEVVSIYFSQETVIILGSPPSDLCTLTRLNNEQGVSIPIARSYDGHGWERAGGSFASRLQDWLCDQEQCVSVLPAGSYRLITRNPHQLQLSEEAAIARFLEQATFGVTEQLLTETSSFTEFIRDQIEVVPPTYHREYFRRRANPIWRVHKPEFAAKLNPCAAGSTWRRHALTVKDKIQRLTLTRTDDGEYWQIAVAGHVRSVVPNFRTDQNPPREWSESGAFDFCIKDDRAIYRGNFLVRQGGRCRQILLEDLEIQFPDGLQPDLVLSQELPGLSDADSWQRQQSDMLDEYRLTTAIIDPVCDSLAAHPYNGPPIFAKTVAGEWLIFTPRIEIQENSVSAPLRDGGADNWINSRTMHCSNAPRSFLNENACVLSTGTACRAGSSNSSLVETGVVVCPSLGEVANDPSLGSNWLDVASLPLRRAVELRLPRDLTEVNNFSRQREFIWSDVVLGNGGNSNDQLRQRVSWALFQIFALDKGGIQMEKQQTESFLNYYDIFVRNAFGNYLDILREVSYNALMAESLSFLDNKSIEASLNESGAVFFPDENFSRELMQLFTLGLAELELDGSSIPEAEETYDNDNIMDFARAWTGFVTQKNRANIENFSSNNIDPLRIVPEWRDRFPKTNLYDGYLGDGFPLCVDLPERAFLRTGAKYRLLGSSAVPELISDDSSWAESENTKRLTIQKGTGLYDRLCAPLAFEGFCTFPSVVVLESNLSYCESGSSAAECSVETVRVVQVEGLFYEYVRDPCVELSFYQNPKKIAHAEQSDLALCANPLISVASEACCEADLSSAHPACIFSGERMTMNGAKNRCESLGKTLCDFRSFGSNEECPHAGYHWTGEDCRVRVKVQSDGRAAIVHDVTPANPPTNLQSDTPNLFKVYWGAEGHPTVANNCGGGSCEILESACICDITVSERPIFVTPAPSSALILELLRVGHADPAVYDDTVTYYTVQQGIDYRYHSLDGSCCDIDTVFEVTDRNGITRFLRNVGSSVAVVGTEYSFRNPPHFNSLISTEYSVADAQHETEALLQHLFYHANTAPFVASRFIQRFTGSNPSPRYVRAVASAFQEGTYKATTAESFGSGRYGDMTALVSAVLLDREARSPTLMADPAHGSLKEPLLKVTGFMRAMEFTSTIPLVELDSMNTKIGQMVFEQNSVFSFFSPGYSPPGPTASAMLSAPESQVMSASKVIGLLNGLFSLIRHGLSKCDDGFGAYGGCSSSSQASGYLTYEPDSASVVGLSILLTSGRLSQEKQSAIQQIIDEETDKEKAFRLALLLIVTAPEFHTTSPIDQQAAPIQTVEVEQDSQAPEQGYKAVIHLALEGGCDSFNMLVPHSSCGRLHQEYKDVRGSLALRDTQVQKIEGDTSGQPCASFGLHGQLTFVKSLYDEEDLLFLANTGVLTQPVDGTDYREKTVARLFAHDAMQEEVGSLDPLNSAVGTGALGRMADVLQLNGFKTSRIAVETTPASLAGRSSSRVLTLDENGVMELNVDPSQPTLEGTIQDSNVANQHSGMLGELWSSILGQSLNQTQELLELLGDTSQQPDFAQKSSLGKQFHLIGQLIEARDLRNANRDVFTVVMKGFDSHSDQADTLQDRFQELDVALEEFVTKLKADGVWENVVVVQSSEFGRTLSSNGSGGTDHAWGGNYWIAGGSVRGSRILGEYPSTLITDGQLILDRGRVIPTTPWDSIQNAVTDWMGGESISSEQLDYCLPNRARFPNLFSSEDLFS